MLIADLLRHKGSAVITIGQDDLVPELVARLAEHKIGALVVADGDRIIGIVSERDVVRRLNDQGADVLKARVADLMTTDVISCSPSDSIDQIGSSMTEERIRHMPVVADGKLAGIVTIGDVVAARIRQLEQDRGQLENYITHG
jgi:CBS domain-containing protein